VAADRPACARLVAVAPAGRSAASYTTLWDTTAKDDHRDEFMNVELEVHRLPNENDMHSATKPCPLLRKERGTFCSSGTPPISLGALIGTPNVPYRDERRNLASLPQRSAIGSITEDFTHRDSATRQPLQACSSTWT
jgi:hypothetical protein